MRSWSHVALLAFLSIKWLTTCVLADNVFCDDPELCSNELDKKELLPFDQSDSQDGDLLDRTLRGDPFIRFGRGDPFLRFGRGDPFLRFGRGDPFIRFGRGDPFIRFGKRDSSRVTRGDPFIRFGRSDPYIRFGRNDPYLRFGRNEPYLRFGRGDPFIRFGRGDPFLRFGKSSSDGRAEIEEEILSRVSADEAVKPSRKRRSADVMPHDEPALEKRSSAELKSSVADDKALMEVDVREIRAKPYMRFGRNNDGAYLLEDMEKLTSDLSDDGYGRYAREPSRSSYPRFGKRDEVKRSQYMRFGRAQEKI
ncbi:FMRFamide-related neuropeptides-like isoform X1 [Physella acuta]|uniref:FMRFamide-related neuropeptides-like isoform X1 n=1 Tax=Physella acuta TaxID=109671 RepID=UPI0027DE8A77|nr:FMRFamide-related neuropeptides-like isoform X1 [Physella acuta]